MENNKEKEKRWHAVVLMEVSCVSWITIRKRAFPTKIQEGNLIIDKSHQFKIPCWNERRLPSWASQKSVW